MRTPRRARPRVRRDAPAAACLALAVFAARAVADPAGAGADALEWRGARLGVRALGAGPAATYLLTATETDGTSRTRQVAEPAGRPYVRSGNALFDGAFALSQEELAADSVAAITDAAFNEGKALPCECFETGEKWHYVWTRDLSYAADLGLAYLDPARTRTSLLFKESEVRPRLLAEGVAPARVALQDTGSGGSWPVSTDRVVWIHAASETLASLEGAEAAAFGRTLYRIARDTLAQDRTYAFDPRVGLYRGETSFLDWREQNYPAWTATDTRPIAESYALSSNVLHLVALRDTARLAARFGEAEAAARFRHDAKRLGDAINRQFWLPDSGLYASYLLGGARPWAVPTFDLLGESLAVLHGVADEARARTVVAAYPSSSAGPPVIWPQLPGIPIYHNRAIWPFVTAYALRAAVEARNAPLADQYFTSLLRGALLAQSNRENFEFLTQATAFADGALSGPVVNSPRQLWSVAAYAGAVIGSLFGVRVEPESLKVAPHLPAELVARLLRDGRTLELDGLVVRGRALAVTLVRPAAAAPGAWLEGSTWSLNARPIKGPGIPYALLSRTRANALRIELKAAGGEAPPPHLVEVQDPHALTAAEHERLYVPDSPPAPVARREGGLVRLELPPPAARTTLEVYRDGERLPDVGAGSQYGDRLPDARATACYSLVQRWSANGQASLPGPETCVAGSAHLGPVSVDAPAVNVHGAHLAHDRHGRALLEDWGAPSQVLEVRFVPAATGLQQLKLDYTESAAPVNTGITAAVKRVSVRCAGREAPERGVVVMPHLGRREAENASTRFLFEATAARPCVVRVTDGFNMSYLEHFKLYTGGVGGRSGPENRASISAFEFDFLGAAP